MSVVEADISRAFALECVGIFRHKSHFGKLIMKTVLSICVMLFAVTKCFAEKNAELPLVLAERGKILFEDDFAAGKLSDDWSQIRGAWTISDGVVVGKELKADDHAAVFHCMKKNRNSIVRYSFKLDGAKEFHFSLNYQKGHLFRIVVNSDGLAVRTDGSKRDKSIKSEPIGKAHGRFEQGKWYTMQIEMLGDKVAVSTDNGLKVEGQNSRLDTSKPHYRFILKDEALVIDDMKVWATKS